MGDEGNDNCKYIDCTLVQSMIETNPCSEMSWVLSLIQEFLVTVLQTSRFHIFYLQFDYPIVSFMVLVVKSSGTMFD